MNALEQIVAEYELEIEGVRFWVPYWVNIAYTLDGKALNTAEVIRGPYKGKGTPAQIKAALIARIAKDQLHPKSPEEYRAIMRKFGIGVDCSGFTYYVLNKYLRVLHHKPLATFLAIPKADVVEAWEKYHKQERKNVPDRKTVLSLTDPVPMIQFTRLFHKSPIHHTNVKRLTDANATNVVKNTADIRLGDLIKMTSKWGDHIGIVVNVTISEIIFASSDSAEPGFGGITLHTITITSPKEGLEKQDWRLKNIYNFSSGDGVFRPKALV